MGARERSSRRPASLSVWADQVQGRAVAVDPAHPGGADGPLETRRSVVDPWFSATVDMCARSVGGAELARWNGSPIVPRSRLFLPAPRSACQARGSAPTTSEQSEAVDGWSANRSDRSRHSIRWPALCVSNQETQPGRSSGLTKSSSAWTRSQSFCRDAVRDASAEHRVVPTSRANKRPPAGAACLRSEQSRGRNNRRCSDVGTTPNRARMAGALGGLWHALRSRELLRPERHLGGIPHVAIVRAFWGRIPLASNRTE